MRDVRTSCGSDSVILTSETEGRTEVAKLGTKSATKVKGEESKRVGKGKKKYLHLFCRVQATMDL